ATMRAVAVAPVHADRIPRIAVVRRGRIVDEILVKDGSRVTVGTSEEALLVVRDASHLPPSFELIERVGDKHWLRFTAGMSGTRRGPGGPMPLAAVRGRAHVAGGVSRFALADDARGKIVVGDTVFLFQIVARPPAPPRPQLPLSLTSGLGAFELDWSLTILV